MTELDPILPSLLADKSRTSIKQLKVARMRAVTAEVRQSLARMVLEILKGNGGSLEELNLYQSGFSANLGNAICQALGQSD